MLSSKELKKQRIVSQHQTARNLFGLFQPTMFMRFFPDDPEPGTPAKPEPGSTATATAAVIDEHDQEIEAATKEAGKQKQLAEQEAGNARRAEQRASDAEARTTELEQEVKTNKTKLVELETKAAEAGIDVVELNEDDYEHAADKALVRNLKALNKKLDARETAAKADRTENKKARDAFKANQENTAALAARNQRYDELLSDLDVEHGAEHRNAAVKAFNQLMADGKIAKDRPGKATLAMVKCYKDAAKAAEAAKKKTAEDGKPPLLDTGEGGGQRPTLGGVELPDDLSLDEAVTRIAAASKTKG